MITNSDESLEALHTHFFSYKLILPHIHRTCLDYFFFNTQALCDV